MAAATSEELGSAAPAEPVYWGDAAEARKLHLARRGSSQLCQSTPFGSRDLGGPSAPNIYGATLGRRRHMQQHRSRRPSGRARQRRHEFYSGTRNKPWMSPWTTRNTFSPPTILPGLKILVKPNASDMPKRLVGDRSIAARRVKLAKDMAETGPRRRWLGPQWTRSGPVLVLEVPWLSAQGELCRLGHIL